MGLFNFFRKRSNDVAEKNVHLAMAYLEEVHNRIVGEPISLGVRLVTSEILNNRPAQYESVKTPEAFRLGIINCFALKSAIDPELKAIGVIITPSNSISNLYKQDHYGPNKVSIQDYLSAFGIDINFDSVLDPTSFHNHIKQAKKLLAITSDSLSLPAIKGFFKDTSAVIYPIISDDGKVAKLVNA